MCRALVGVATAFGFRKPHGRRWGAPNEAGPLRPGGRRPSGIGLPPRVQKKSRAPFRGKGLQPRSAVDEVGAGV